MPLDQYSRVQGHGKHRSSCEPVLSCVSERNPPDDLYLRRALSFKFVKLRRRWGWYLPVSTSCSPYHTTSQNSLQPSAIRRSTCNSIFNRCIVTIVAFNQKNFTSTILAAALTNPWLVGRDARRREATWRQKIQAQNHASRSFRFLVCCWVFGFRLAKRLLV